jgi:hypothetical protein
MVTSIGAMAAHTAPCSRLSNRQHGRTPDSSWQDGNTSLSSAGPLLLQRPT